MRKRGPSLDELINDSKKRFDETLQKEADDKEKLLKAVAMLEEKDVHGKNLYSKNQVCLKVGVSKPKLCRFLQSGISPNVSNAIFSAQEEGTLPKLVLYFLKY